MIYVHKNILFSDINDTLKSRIDLSINVKRNLGLPLNTCLNKFLVPNALGNYKLANLKTALDGEGIYLLVVE